MHIFYTILSHLAFLLVLPILVLHPKLRDGFLHRLGFLPEGWPGNGIGPKIWFHGASAGDLAALQPVVDKLRQSLPDAFFVVTTVTNSGMSWAKTRLQGVDSVGFLPYDLLWAVGRVVRAIQPDVLVLEYAEVWPALIRATKKTGAGIMITNGRFHERALGHYRFLYRIIGNPLKKIDIFCMRDSNEAQHALDIGAPSQRVRVCGNTKFDSSCVPDNLEQSVTGELAKSLGITETKRVLFAGSTHDGEESYLLDVFVSLKKDYPDLHLVIAPRYLERVDRIVALVRERGLDCGLRSTGASRQAVVVLDTVGELGLAYTLATVVFVGGSFVRRGGQNIIEPASCGKPVLFGPHMENFRDSVQVLLGRGAVQVANPQKLEAVIRDLFSDPVELDKLGRMAKDSVSSYRGASENCAQAVLELIEKQQQLRD